MDIQCHNFDTNRANERDWRSNGGEQFNPAKVLHKLPLPVNSEGPQSHLRNLTILFSDLSSSVDLSAQVDCFDYVGFLHVLRAMFRTSVERHRGSIARLQGDGVLAIFGHDGASKDDGYRAICCALELHEAARAITVGAEVMARAALHSGIYSGLTYLESGDLERGRFDLIGNAPNLAARLSGLADRDSIVVTEQVISPHLGDFSVANRRELQIKGWPTPIPAYVVTGRAVPDVTERHTDAGAQDPSSSWRLFGPDRFVFP